MPPAALTQLIREVIEWCADADGAPAVGYSMPTLGLNEFVHLVLSINGDQERQDTPDFFESWPPCADDMKKYFDAMTVDDDFVLRELRRRMLSDMARMQTHATTVPDLALGDTYDTWFKGWPSAAPHDLIGDTPEDAFEAATGVKLREFIKLGLKLWDRTKTGKVALDLSSLRGEIDAGDGTDAECSIDLCRGIPQKTWKRTQEGVPSPSPLRFHRTSAATPGR